MRREKWEKWDGWDGWIDIQVKEPPSFTAILLAEEGMLSSFLGCWNPEKRLFCKASSLKNAAPMEIPLENVEITHWSWMPTPPREG